MKTTAKQPKTKRNRGKCNSSLWTKEKIMQLIASFESNSDLWDVSSQLYSNRNHRQNLLKKISEEIELDVVEIVGKFHNLRCQYNAQLRKLKKRNRGSKYNGLYEKRWEFFNALKFLSTSGQSCSTALISEVAEENSSQELNVSDPGVIFKAKTVVSPKRPYQRKKTTSIACSQNGNILSNAVKILESPTDSHQIFGDYIADQLRHMTEAKQKRLKLLIQKAVIQVEEEHEMVLIPPPSQTTLTLSPRSISPQPCFQCELRTSQTPQHCELKFES